MKNDKEHAQFIKTIFDNQEVLKKILDNDKALSNMISDMISDMIKNNM